MMSERIYLFIKIPDDTDRPKYFKKVTIAKQGPM